MPDHNEQELNRLEQELRSFGEPYSADLPNEEYFAGFRSRLDAKLDAKDTPINEQKSSFFTKPVRLTVGTFCIVAAIVAVWLIPKGSDAVKDVVPSVVQTPYSAEQLQPARAKEPEQMTTKSSSSDETSAGSNTQESVMSPRKHVPASMTDRAGANTTAKPSAGDLSSPQIVSPAAADDELSEYDDVLSTGNDDEPVTYDRLSASELEAILKTIEGIDENMNDDK